MSQRSKVTASHRSRMAVVYVRQSTLIQLERNSESTARQYNLTERAVGLGWPSSAVRIVDADLGNVALSSLVPDEPNAARLACVSGARVWNPSRPHTHRPCQRASSSVTMGAGHLPEQLPHGPLAEAAAPVGDHGGAGHL
jgi:hypothetical protein